MKVVRIVKFPLLGFWSPEDYYGFVNTFKYNDEKVVLDKHTIIQPDKTKVIYNWLQHYSVEHITRELEEAGLVVEEVYNNVAGDEFTEESTEICIIARSGS